MKRAVSLLLSLALALVLLPACAQSGPEPDTPAPEPEAPPNAREMAETVLPASGWKETPDVERLNAEEDADRLSAYIEAVCGLTSEQWEDAAVIRGVGASAFELVVLRLGDEDAATGLEAVLADYLTVRAGAFTGYAPAEAEMAANGRVQREGGTVGLFICPDPEGAGAAFSAAYRGEELPPPAEPGPEPVEEQEEFTPLFEIRDLLHRLLLEAACPEWGELGADDRGWTSGKRDWVESIEAKYGVTEDKFEDFATAYWGPQRFDFVGEVADAEKFDPSQIIAIRRNVYEVAIFQTADEEGAGELAQALNDYKANRLEELGDCQPSELDELNGVTGEDLTAEAEALEQAQAVAAGHYAALIVSEYAEDAALLFPRIVNDPDTSGYFQRYIKGQQPAKPEDPDPDYPDRTRFTPPGEEDMSIYDTSAILTAWEARDPSVLTGDDREIYDSAEAILEEIMQDGMSDLEKETAAYGWLVNNVDYDWTHQDALAETDRRSYGPYGGLVNRAAVCLGYATSFQLLMDMSGVECITVVGACSNSTGDHAWNMVKLNGEWYCVDVTWDANGREQLGADYAWRYLNITSGEMGKNHQWDYANTPEATAEDRGGAAVRE